MARASVEVRCSDLPEFKQAVALLAEAYEALCGACSEGWDIFSGPTKEELVGVMDRIQDYGA